MQQRKLIENDQYITEFFANSQLSHYSDYLSIFSTKPQAARIRCQDIVTDDTRHGSIMHDILRKLL